MSKGIIPPCLKIEHQGRLTYTEERLLDAFMIYAGKVNRENGQGDFYAEGQGRALARLIFLLEPDAVKKAIEFYLVGKQELEKADAPA